MVSKFCSGCKEELPRSSFYKQAGKKDGLRDQCKGCYKDKNSDSHKARTAQRRANHKKWFYDNVLSKSKCVECDESHPAVLDFHHIDPKTKVAEVSWMVSQLINIEKIEIEIAKCDVLCSNCHRKFHWNKSR